MLGYPGRSQAEQELDTLPVDARPVISDISLWEFATLVDLGKIKIDPTSEALERSFALPSRSRVWRGSKMPNWNRIRFL